MQAADEARPFKSPSLAFFVTPGIFFPPVAAYTNTSWNAPKEYFNLKKKKKKKKWANKQKQLDD